MKFIFKFILVALAIMGVAYLVPGFIVVSFWSALLLAVVMAVINTLVRPILIVLTLPITILTLGIFILILNALLLWFGSSLVFGVSIESFAAAFWGSILISLASWIINSWLE